jgi:hypothetical protein
MLVKSARIPVPQILVQQGRNAPVQIKDSAIFVGVPGQPQQLQDCATLLAEMVGHVQSTWIGITASVYLDGLEQTAHRNMLTATTVPVV